MALLEVRDLTVEYRAPGRTVRAVDAVSFDLAAGEVAGIVGESGSGKTTIVLAVLRLVPEPGFVVRGSICLDGTDLRALSRATMRGVRGREIAYVPQAAMSSLNPVMTVGRQIDESLELHTALSPSERASRMRQMLDLVELETAVAGRYPHELSGGMRQRAVIAMALAARPRVVLADEPTSGLDVLVRAQVLALVRRAAAELGSALLLVSHDLPLVSRWCDRALVMYAGRIVEEGPAAELLTAPLHPYAQGLARSLPRLHGVTRPQAIGGEVPDLSDVPSGCPFHPRCRMAFEACPARTPVLVGVGTHRVACHLHDH